MAERLTDVYRGRRSAAQVDAAVAAAVEHFAGSRIRDFVPVLAERRARSALDAAAAPGPGPEVVAKAFGPGVMAAASPSEAASPPEVVPLSEAVSPSGIVSPSEGGAPPVECDSPRRFPAHGGVDAPLETGGAGGPSNGREPTRTPPDPHRLTSDFR
ncbi:hypothetical protein WN71_009685 [Streptomyces mangrovisoli]|uniref:Uncharacterized protein n=1 Tax=Streptomyces mangrovisoli TaxID=1428628 RepID=A0A1J4P3K2_9ACTN|nr:hypothetical protein [Streptomyces mangrovisoli]OIJ68061.1 hypothetical protein WN71_009685 [Streptomyces mangrovisoli]